MSPTFVIILCVLSFLVGGFVGSCVSLSNDYTDQEEDR